MCMCQDLVRKQHARTESLEDSLIKNRMKQQQHNDYLQSVGRVWREHQG